MSSKQAALAKGKRLFPKPITGLTGRINDDGSFTIIDPDEEGHIFVRVDGDEAQTFSVLNKKTSAHRKHDLAVTLKMNARGRYEVDEVNEDQPYLPKSLIRHFQTGERAGDLIQETVRAENFKPGRWRIVSGMIVYIEPFYYDKADGSKAHWPGGNLDLTSNLPATTGYKAPVVGGVDPATNTATAFTGTEVPATFPPISTPYALGSDFADTINAGGTDIAWTRGVVLFEGQTALTSTDDFVSVWSVVTESPTITPSTGYDYILLQDQKAATVNGGNFAAGSYQVRDLNTEVADTAGRCSLNAANGQFTLTPGTYIIHASAPAYQVDYHNLRLYDVTNAAMVVIGQISYCAPSSTAQVHAFLKGRFVVSTTTTYRLEHRCQTPENVEGFGWQNPWDIGIFAQVEMWAHA